VSKYFNEEKSKLYPLIRQQIREGLERGAEWMIRMRNTTTGEVFPLYVGNGRNPKQEFVRYVEANGDNFDPIECYDFSKNLEDQVTQDNNQNWDRGLPIERGNFSMVTPWPK
jgi:hypothetical protein